MLDENQVVDLLSSYFEKLGYKIIQKKTTKETGIDLIVKLPTDKFCHYIEVKGDTSSRQGSENYGEPFDSKKIINRIGKALFSAMQAVDVYKTSGKFGIAVPNNNLYISYFSRIRNSLRKLGITVYLVSRESVEKL